MNVKTIDDRLYLRILQLGRENLTQGLKFNTLISTLQKEGYTINNCTNRSIREWFYNSFFHEEAHCSNGNYNNVQELDNHKNCGFVLKAETCMKLLQYEEAEKSNTQIELLTSQSEIYQKQVQILQSQLGTLQQQIKLSEQSSNEANAESKSARVLAICAIIISALFGFPDWITLFNHDTNKDILTTNNQIKKTIEEGFLQSQESLSRLDTLIYHVDNYIKIEKNKKPLLPNASNSKNKQANK